MASGGKEAILSRTETILVLNDPAKNNGWKGFEKEHRPKLKSLEMVCPGACSKLEEFASALKRKDFEALDELDFGRIRKVPLGEELMKAVRNHFFRRN